MEIPRTSDRVLNDKKRNGEKQAMNKLATCEHWTSTIFMMAIFCNRILFKFDLEKIYCMTEFHKLTR